MTRDLPSKPADPSEEQSIPLMRAVVQRAYGSVDVLSLIAVPVPKVADREVLVRVHAAAVNHADWVYTSGRPLIARLAFGFPKPKLVIRGKDFAGTVESVGGGDSRFRVGDEVLRRGASGEFC